MVIYVCIKQVPDTETKIKPGNVAFGIDGTGVKWIMNPYDEFAVEEALKIKGKNPAAQVKVISVGPAKRVSDAIRTALAMGADEGIAVDAPDSLDTFATSKALAQLIKQEGAFDLIFMGKLAIDDNSSSVPQMVASLLGIPHVNVISKFELADGLAKVERETDGGNKEIIEVKLPAVLGANKGLNDPRYASLPGIMKAKKKTIKELALSAVGVTGDDQKIKFTDLRLPPDKAPVKVLAGDVDAQVTALVKALREEAKVI